MARVRSLSQYFSVALNIYDYAITFEAERTRIWKRKRTRVSLLFLANRYLAILYSAVIILKLGDSIEAVSAHQRLDSGFIEPLFRGAKPALSQES